MNRYQFVYDTQTTFYNMKDWWWCAFIPFLVSVILMFSLGKPDGDGLAPSPLPPSLMFIILFDYLVLSIVIWVWSCQDPLSIIHISICSGIIIAFFLFLTALAGFILLVISYQVHPLYIPIVVGLFGVISVIWLIVPLGTAGRLALKRNYNAPHYASRILAPPASHCNFCRENFAADEVIVHFSPCECLGHNLCKNEWRGITQPCPLHPLHTLP